MKTLLSLLSTLALITAIASFDGYRLDAGMLFSAFAVAVLAAFALTDGRGPIRPSFTEHFSRFPRPVSHLGSPRPRHL
jgi:hypothetical protein